jgi:hypothetical protein
MDGAATYAKETWGIPIPSSLKPYTSAALYGISKKVDKYKEEKQKRDDK